MRRRNGGLCTRLRDAAWYVVLCIVALALGHAARPNPWALARWLAPRRPTWPG